MLLCHLFIFHPQIRCLCPTLLFPSRGREKPGGTSRLWLHSWPPADRPNRNPLLPTTRLPLPITREPQRAVFQPPTHAHTHLPATHTLSHTRADSSRGGGAEERLQPANQGSAFQLALQRLLRSLSAPLLRWGGCFTCVSFSVINSRPFALRRVSSGFLLVLLTPTEHPVLWHAVVMWASHHGVDQCIRDADEPAAAPQLLRPASSLGGSPRPLAEAGARLIQ